MRQESDLETYSKGSGEIGNSIAWITNLEAGQVYWEKHQYDKNTQ